MIRIIEGVFFVLAGVALGIFALLGLSAVGYTLWSIIGWLLP